MRFLWITALKDLQRLRREPVTLITWIAIPSFVAVILTLVFGPGGAHPHGTLLIADQDGGFGAGMVAGAFSQGDLGRILTVEKVDREEGRRRMDRGEASALLVIPPGFTTALFTATPVTVDLIRNPAQRILPDMIEETLAIITDRASAMQATRGAALPPLIELEAKVIPDQTEQPAGFAAILLPGTLFMGVFFIAGALAADVWRERTSGALRRIATTPASLTAFLIGKLLAAAAVLASVGALGLFVAHQLMHLRVANFPAAILWIAVSGCGLYLMMMILQSAASSERVATFLTNFITLPLVMLGGGFVPLAWMPNTLSNIGRWTPNGWAVTQLGSILTGSLQPAAPAVIAAFIVLALILNVRTIRRFAC